MLTVKNESSPNGQERVVAYGSRLLTKPERRYCVTRRELLAVVTFTKQYRAYLTGRRFLLRTDSHGGWRGCRSWTSKLCTCRRGKKHTNADVLSRLPCMQTVWDTHDSLVPAIVAVATLRSPQGNASEELRDAQLVDPVLGLLLRDKEAGRKPSADELGSVSRSSRRLLQIWDQLIVHGGVLGRRFETPEGSRARWPP